MHDAASQVIGRSFDGWTAGFPTLWLAGEGAGALVAVGMNGEPLTADHGFPARLIVPGLFGYVSATKWLTELELTTFEYKLLEYLMLHAGEVVSKTQITEALYDQDFERDSNVIEVFIGRLRRKLDPDETLRPIETLRGRGYRFAISRAA